MAATRSTRTRQGPTAGWVRRTSDRRSQGRAASVVLQVCLVCVATLGLWGSLAACSLTSTPGPTNVGPFSELMRDIQAAGITVLEAAEGPSEVASKGELYVRVLATEGQNPGAVADKLIALVHEYKKRLHLRWLHVVVVSTEGWYDRVFDLNGTSSSAGLPLSGSAAVALGLLATRPHGGVCGFAETSRGTNGKDPMRVGAYVASIEQGEGGPTSSVPRRRGAKENGRPVPHASGT